jgi:hypothetical protein
MSVQKPVRHAGCVDPVNLCMQLREAGALTKVAAE